jgi:hypothetical protein
MITTIIEREAEPILISDLTWREFKAVEQLIDRPAGYTEKFYIIPFHGCIIRKISA